MPSNEFLAFCPTDTGSNLLSQAAYLAATDRSIGNQPGIASSALVNKALRQSSWVSNQLSQYIVNTTGLDLLDDENSTNFQTAITAALGVPTSPRGVTNLGLSASVAGNAMTIALKDAAGSNPSGASPVKIAFRSSTATTGTYSVQSITGALSVVVPSGASLGQTSAVNQYVWVYAIYDGASVQLGVSGVNVFDDLSVQSSTTISAGATSGIVLYSTTGISNKPIRLIGRVLVNEATAGTWATTPAELAAMPVPRITETPWTAYTPAFVSFGTVTSINFKYKRIGDSVFVQGKWTNGSNTGVTATITMPSGVTINTLVGFEHVGTGAQTGNISTFGVNIDTGTDATKLVFSNNSGNYQIKMVGTAFDTSATNSINVGPMPVVGWSTYGP